MPKFSIILYLFIFFFTGCGNKKQSKKNTIILKKENKIYQHWDSLFTDKKVIHFDKGENNLVLGRIAIDNKNNIVTHSFSQNVLFFDSSGSLIRSIGRKGKGPGEFINIQKMTFDSENNLWVYDPNLRRLSVFRSPSFKLKKSFNLEPYLYDFVVDSNGNIIAYTSSKDYLITIFNKEGNVISKKLKPIDKSFRIHSNRYNLGGVAKTRNPSGFYVVYPGQYVINFFNKDYKLTSVVKPLYKNSSKYRPDPPPFPKNYDPYKAHLEYWNSFLHVHDVFSTSDMIILFLSENIPKDKYRFYINIYSKDGVIIAEGLHIPQNAMLIATKENKIFTWVRGEVDSNGEMKPQKLISYQLKKVN